MDGIGWMLVKDRDTSPDVIGRMDMVRVVVRLGGGKGWVVYIRPSDMPCVSV